jgi:hypothetical protein
VTQDLPTAPDQAAPDQLAVLRTLLISQGAVGVADDESLLRAARESAHKLGVTVLSAWEAAGRQLLPEHQSELADNRRRIDRYSKAWSLVSSLAPDARIVKGPVIGAHYPAGLLRAAGDLDVICPEEQLWPAVKALVAEGWQVGALTILNPRTVSLDPGQRAQAGPVASIELNQPTDSDAIDEAYGVELRSVDVATSLRLPAWRLTGPPMPQVAASVLALVAERWERPFRSRDIYDLAMLAGQLGEEDRASLLAAMNATGLWPELRELTGLLRRWRPQQAPDLPGSRIVAARARGVRLARSAVQWLHPLRVIGYLSMMTVDKDRGPIADKMATAVHQRIGTARLLKLGQPLFAVPLSSTVASKGGMLLVRCGAHLVAVTPIGSFLLVSGACQEIWLDEAAQRLAQTAGTRASQPPVARR